MKATMTVCLLTGLWLSACQPAAPPPAPAPDPAAVKAAQVERGRYLVSALGGCNDCHTPMAMTDKGPAPDMSRLLSGHPSSEVVAAPSGLPAGWLAAFNTTGTAFAGPWGVSFSRNLTPDQATGLGSWTEEMFIQTIRLGKHQGVGRDLLPPMPWPVFSQATDEDLRAIWAYLQSIPAIENAVPDPIPPAAPPAGAPMK